MLTVETVEFNNKRAIDIVFLAEGFQSNEMTLFNTKVTDAVTALFSYEPFSQNRSKFNIYKVPTVSNESGVSVISVAHNPTTPITVDTYWGVFKNRAGLPRFTGISEENRLRLETELKDHFRKKVFAVIIVNDGTYAGSGEFPVDTMVSTAIASIDTEFNVFPTLFTHEFGHSFGNLDDEYEDETTVNCLHISDPGLLYGENKGNISNSPVTDRKWDFLDNPEYIEGGRYVSEGKYRSTNSSLMKSVSPLEDFSELQKILLQKRIDEEFKYNRFVHTIRNNNVRDIKFKRRQANLRVHADEFTIDEDLICNEIYVSVGTILTITGEVKAKKVINRGQIIGNIEII